MQLIKMLSKQQYVILFGPKLISRSVELLEILGYAFRGHFLPYGFRRQLKEAIEAFSKAYHLEALPETKDELEEVSELRWKSISERINIEGLVLYESFGEGLGPGGVFWDSGFRLVELLQTMSTEFRSKFLPFEIKC